MTKESKGVKRPSSRRLHGLLKTARRRRAQAKGWRQRLRRSFYAGWVSLLVWAAEATLKKWLAVLGVFLLLWAGLFLFQQERGNPKFGLSQEIAIESAEFLPSIAGATGAPFVPGNRIDPLFNGDQFYPAILEAIGGAQHSINIEAYIFWDDPLGNRVADALIAKARGGVAIRVLVDAVGSRKMSSKMERKLEDGGCRVARFHPVWFFTIDRISNRTHREITVVDGRIGFQGGAGYAEHWTGNAQDPEHWRDTLVRIEGPAVTQLQTGFAQKWLETTGEVVSGPDYFPQIEQSGALSIQTILSEPETNSSTARILYYLSIISARKSILIANPYFIPNDEAIDILVAAKRRGVDVKIIVPGEHNDHGLLARRNSSRLYGKLLEAGVEIYEYNRTMMHQKFMVCDGVWTTVGTINFDYLSFTLNDENNVCVYDRDFAAGFEAVFRKDLEACNRIELEEWRNRGIHVKAIEAVMSIFKRMV
ncbi:MAG: cardiolipin synthase [Pyrinomonadaceae bacterium]|nr:cardiolipin synthase [Pyrinomonadaceae bacterium]